MLKLVLGNLNSLVNLKFNVRLQIYDGPSAAYPVLAKLCGHDKLNKSIKSTYNHMFVEMVTDAYNPTKGFLAQYEMVVKSVLNRFFSNL